MIYNDIIVNIVSVAVNYNYLLMKFQIFAMFILVYISYIFKWSLLYSTTLSTLFNWRQTQSYIFDLVLSSYILTVNQFDTNQLTHANRFLIDLHIPSTSPQIPAMSPHGDLPSYDNATQSAEVGSFTSHNICVNNFLNRVMLLQWNGRI